MHRPVLSHPGLYDPTTIMSTVELNKAMKEGWIYLAFYIVSFFYYLYGMIYTLALVCALSNETPEDPVISPISGHIFERRLILKYLEENGVDPIAQQPLSPDDLIQVKSSSLVLPKPPSATSIPALLKALQDEWDSVLLQSFSMRQQLQTARQELSHALYQHDAACRVIARLNKEVTAAREALATLKPQAGVAQLMVTSVESGEAADTNVQEVIGISQDVISELQKKSNELTAERKKRGKTVPEGLVSASAISAYQQVASHTGIHSSSQPGILSLDMSKAKPERIVTGGNDKNAVVFDLQSEQIIASLSGHGKRVTRVAYHPTEQLCFTGSQDHTVRVWGVDQAHCASVIRAHTGTVTGLSVHATGDYILSAATDGKWAFSDLRKGKVLARVGDSYDSLPALTCAQFHPDGQILGTGTVDGEVKIWEIRAKKNVANFGHGSGPDQDVTCLAFSENGYFLATGGKDGQIKLWDLRKLKNFKVLMPNDDMASGDDVYSISDLEFDHSGTYLAVAGSDVRVYLCKQWDQLACFNAHTSTSTGVRFGRNATSLISSSLDRSVKVYSTPSMELS
ncbi:Pre-mRNA-processing factor 19 [Cichlidogyrus casuarinus]|uniref:Pre-mRNA-processing factor 19 n=1 Tax=Cichlidogyrus casuarinus TaxID=1844966 RepID=A0ABD2QHN3_9PLAT